MTSKYDFTETPEQEEARKSVRAFWFGHYRDEPIILADPVVPMLDPPELPVKPAPASLAPRYGHSTLKKCQVEGCETLIGSHQQRCKPHAKARHTKLKTEARQAARVPAAEVGA